jgi:hypothetical protein
VRLKALLYFCIAIVISFPPGCQPKGTNTQNLAVNSKGQAIYQDSSYLQNFSIKYYFNDEQLSKKTSNLSLNRDGQIRVLCGNKLWVPDNGSMLYSGKLIADVAYTQMQQKQIKAMLTYKEQTIFLDSKQVFSNAWAGKLQIDHQLPGARIFAAGSDFQFLVSDGTNLILLNEKSEKLWSGQFDKLIQIKYQENGNRFLLVSPTTVAEFTSDHKLNELFRGNSITCIEPMKNGNIAVGTSSGYHIFPNKEINAKLPCGNITCISEIAGELWFGSSDGVFKLNKQGKYDYYAYERWLPGNQVLAIEKGPDQSVLILTDKGLAQIQFEKMTLEDKALFFEKQVRQKNIRYGINSSSVQLVESYSSAQTGNQPSDNLWTGMYLASQMFRYKATGSEEAKQNAYESFEAMERMHSVTGIAGLFARSYERDYILANTKTDGWQKRELVTGSPALLWLPAKDHPNWTWRSTASSDQTVGQIFGLTAVLELSDDEALKARAVKCLDNLMNYIVDNNLYIIDVDGQPTMWGKWNPEYVNKFPTNVGDRKICSSNIIAFLQTAYHFTKNEKYKNKAFELMEKFGYLDNLMRPMKQIGPSDNDPVSKSLSEEWNHSDDEMYFLAYWGLYPYAFNPELKEKFREAIRDHWDIERPERNALWNFTYAMTGAKDFDLDQSIGFLKNYPLDLRSWTIKNSQRKDIELIPANFRGQTTKELLPLAEIPLYRHNGQIFALDSNGDGKSLISAGDVWLLPYWMGRYLGVISAPIRNNSKN